MMIESTMEYLRCLFCPIDTNRLYHTYTGNISRIERGQGISYIYFKEHPTVKFKIYSRDLPNNIQEEERVLINYQEIVTNYTSFYIITLDIVPNLKSNSLGVYCLFCGHTLLLRSFKQCNGYIVKHYEWDDILLEDVYKYNVCSDFWCNNRDGILGSRCQRQKYTCAHCDTTREI